jgi:aminodeoxyfutalosine deaminase
VHLEGTVRAATLREIAERNGYALPDDQFIEVFELRMGALQTYDDFRRIVVEYAAEAASHGAAYLEAIFSPGLGRGLDQEEVFSGCGDGAQEARELFGVEVRLTPDLPGGYSPEQAQKIATVAVKFRERGVVGLGLVGAADDSAMEPFAGAFAFAREGGLGVVPHAGEVAGAQSVRAALDVLGADRIRHGIRAEEDAGLVRELAARGIVLDVCPLSNVRLGVVASLAEHPLPRLVAAGVCCSISTDDPAMFDTDLTREYDAAVSLGLGPRSLYEAGLAGALCDDETRARLRELGESFDWSCAGERATAHFDPAPAPPGGAQPPARPRPGPRAAGAQPPARVVLAQPALDGVDFKSREGLTPRPRARRHLLTDVSSDATQAPRCDCPADAQGRYPRKSSLSRMNL